MLRDSIVELRESFQAAISDLKEQESQEHRTRTKSAAMQAAQTAVAKSDMKAKVSSMASVAAKQGQKSLEASEKKANQRRMSGVIQHAVSLVADDKDEHDDGEKASGIVPAWQAEHRRRGSSVAMEVAGIVTQKGEVKRRGSQVAIDATKMAIFKGSAVH